MKHTHLTAVLRLCFCLAGLTLLAVSCNVQPLDPTYTHATNPRGETTTEPGLGTAADIEGNRPDESDACLHTFGEWLEEKAATCTEGGSRSRVCSACGKEETEILPALGHEPAWGGSGGTYLHRGR